MSQSVCGFCSTGCSLNIHLRENQAVGLTPTQNYPVNSGMACPKGWEALAVLDSPDRAVTPLLRTDAGKLQVEQLGVRGVRPCGVRLQGREDRPADPTGER